MVQTSWLNHHTIDIAPDINSSKSQNALIHLPCAHFSVPICRKETAAVKHADMAIMDAGGPRVAIAIADALVGPE
ncbi:hypothetical protein MJO28_008613 [Puccinia striiformis f. sp. tritici]|uniref:Uncharacterized protein n=2 Tax=Puccinia striiformis TaxID=27350 RepID=A0A2S4V3S1_9BASI|nr:hypothetical protein MJO28_008613 [Puccinia striiformis f. sp. tritici]POW04182.1 hypothetical protein PSTT_10583 [Puccinia striiformis]